MKLTPLMLRKLIKEEMNRKLLTENTLENSGLSSSISRLEKAANEKGGSEHDPNSSDNSKMIILQHLTPFLNALSDVVDSVTSGKEPQTNQVIQKFKKFIGSISE